MSEVVTLEISLTADPAKEIESSSDHDSPAGNTSGSSESKNNESNQPLKVKTGLQKRAAGFQATLVCLTIANSGEQSENITALSLNSSYGLMAYGNESGIVIIDIVQKISLIVLNTADIGGNTDPCQRVLRSPKRQDELKRENEDKARSPSTDQMNGMCMLPVTRRSAVVVGGSGCGEKGDNADSNSCSRCGNTGDGGCNSESSGGPSTSGVCIPRSGVQNTVNSGDDDIAGSNASSRKSLTIEARQSRAQGIRKLQKCLSTTTNYYELDSSSLNNFPTTSLLSSHRNTEIRGYSSTTPQASFNYQNILSSTRQYNSFGSIIQ